MAKFGQKPTVLTCKSGTFMCYTYGQKVWKFHGERSCDRMPGEENYIRPVLVGESFTRKRSGGVSELDNRKLGRSTSTGSTSSSESECSSQPSPVSETTEDVAHGFLSPASTTTNEEENLPVESQQTTEQDSSTKQQCPPPSPIEVKTKVDIKTLSNLINSLLKKHSLVQTGLELLKQKPALALKLQQRRPRKVLADQGIIPPLKSPGAFHEQRQRLERARTGDFLSKKMLDRPERDYLVQKHILEDTSAYDSIVANQKELKKAQLADDLNEKLFNRPGVFELVEKNILPADDTVTEALKDGNITYKRTTADFEEDSSDAFSPEQPASNEPVVSYGSPVPPVSITLSASAVHSLPSSTWPTESKHDSIMVTSSSSSKMPRSVTSTHTTAGHPYLIRQFSGTKSSKLSPSSLSQRNLRKKKDKPKFKKFKYHQYIPPDQQGKAMEQSMPSMDTPYSRLLEQQQLYLQLQIMNQQYPALIATQKASGGGQMMEGNKSHPTPPPPPAPPMVTNVKPEKKIRNFTIQQLEEMKVAELKEELKARKEKVTGTKEVLIERLKRFAIPGPNPQPSNQPISESITGLINATIQSTIRANTEQALAAAVSNNGPAGALLLKTNALSAPLQQKQEPQQQEQKAITVVPMDTQQKQDAPSTFRFAPTSSSVQVFSTSPAINPTSGTIGLQQTTANSNAYFDANSAGNHGASTGGSSSVPGQRLISSAPGIQFAMNTASSATNQNQPFDYAERHKDNLLHKQQQEIEDLKRMVELHRTQLHRIQEKERTKNPDLSNVNNNSATNTNAMPLPDAQQQHSDMNVDLSTKRQHISQVLQKHLQSRLNGKDVPFLNGVNPAVVKEEFQENAFSFSGNTMPPNVSLISSNVAENPMAGDDSPVILSIKPPVERSISENKDPPKYDQAIQMLNEEKRRFSHHSFGSQDNMTGSPGNVSDFNDVDDLLELLETKGEIPVTPTRQKAFPQVALIEGRIPQHATMNYHYGQRQQSQNRPASSVTHRRSMDHIQRTISCNEVDNMTHHPQRHSLELSMVPLNDMSIGVHAKDPNFQRRHSGDLLSSNRRRHSGDLLSYSGYPPGMQQVNQNDFTSLLVSSAGDILMDANQMPPSNVQGRVSYPSCISPEAVALHPEPVLSSGNNIPTDDSSKGNAFLNFNDPYATQPFSPMDTGTNDAHTHNGMMEERTRDPHLSSSSIHDSAQSLDKCLDAVSGPSNTKSFLRRYEQPLAGSSPRRHPSHLIKSSSQELLSDHMHSMENNMQVDDLGWLDLNLTTASPAPSPMNLQQQQRQSMHSSMGSILEQDTNCNPYNLSSEGFGSTPNEFDLIDPLDLNSIGGTWGGL